MNPGQRLLGELGCCFQNNLGFGFQTPRTGGKAANSNALEKQQQHFRIRVFIHREAGPPQ